MSSHSKALEKALGNVKKFDVAKTHPMSESRKKNMLKVLTGKYSSSYSDKLLKTR